MEHCRDVGGGYPGQRHSGSAAGSVLWRAEVEVTHLCVCFLLFLEEHGWYLPTGVSFVGLRGRGMLSTLGGGRIWPSVLSPPPLSPSVTSCSPALTPPPPPWRKGTGEGEEEEVGRMGLP